MISETNNLCGKIFLIVGRKKRGKTSLVERLIPEFKRRGYKVGSIKHTSCEHEFDIPGKDSYRHTKAGAETTLLLSPQRSALFSSDLREKEPDELLRLFFKGFDLIIGEGLKNSPYPKVEVLDSSRDSLPLCGRRDNLVALVCDKKIDSTIPVFSIKQIKNLVDYLEEQVIRSKRRIPAASEDKLKITGIILAGGKNSRIKTEKAFIQLKPGVSILENSINLFRKIFSEIIVVTNNPLPYLKFGTKVVEDLIKDKGPLGGIFTGMCFSTNQLNFVVACDMPFINLDLIKFMLKQPKGYNVVIPEVDGEVEALFARYSKSSLPVILSSLAENKLKIQDILGRLRVLKVSAQEMKKLDPGLLSFFNLNTEESLKKARDLYSARAKR